MDLKFQNEKITSKMSIVSHEEFEVKLEAQSRNEELLQVEFQEK